MYVRGLSVNLSWTLHNLASLGALRAQILTLRPIGERIGDSQAQGDLMMRALMLVPVVLDLNISAPFWNENMPLLKSASSRPSPHFEAASFFFFLSITLRPRVK